MAAARKTKYEHLLAEFRKAKASVSNGAASTGSKMTRGDVTHAASIDKQDDLHQLGSLDG